MASVRLSSKYQVVIPQEVREQAALSPGQTVEVFYLDGRIQLIPVRPMTELRGSMPGLDTTVEREPDRL